MALTVHAVFDGQVLRPERSVSLEPNKRYWLTVEEDASPSAIRENSSPYPLTALLDVAADLGVADLAERHDQYARPPKETVTAPWLRNLNTYLVPVVA
jgi:hypothetical protein